MTQPGPHVNPEEYVQLRRDASDPQLTALQAAIYLEDALGVVIPDADITPERLSTVRAAEQTVADLERAR